jgi:steroid delta-isomerase-like uncharacterized protein
MATDNIALVRRFVDQVWNRGNMNVCDEILSPKLRTHDPMLGDVDGIESAKQHVRLFRTAFPDFDTSIDDIGAIGDKVYVRWTATGTHRGNMMGITPTNRRGVVHGMTVNRFENNKIVETYYAWDVYGMIEQLGLLPPLQKLAASQPQAAAHA